MRVAEYSLCDPEQPGPLLLELGSLIHTVPRLQEPVGRSRLNLVLSKRGEGLLCTGVPVHRLLRVFPTVVQILTRRSMCGVTVFDGLLEVAVLILNNLIGGDSMKLVVARAAQLSTSHCFHQWASRFLDCAGLRNASPTYMTIRSGYM